MPAYTNDAAYNRQITEEGIGFGASFDCKKRELQLNGRHAALYFISSLSDDLLLADLIERLHKIALPPDADAATFLASVMPYGDAGAVTASEDACRQIMSGASALLVDGFASALMADTRSLPARSVEEPDNDRVLRGARDGFTEILKVNVAVLRRRLRMPTLHIEKTTVGRLSQTDVALCYDAALADPAYVANVKAKLDAIEVDALPLGQESLAECLIQRKWYNPFPKFRYTERPDTAAATLLEGNVLILVDNSPQVMLLPTSIFDFTEESDDYYFPPLTGTYLRFVRTAIFFVTLFFTPLWYLLVTHPAWIPSWLSFIQVAEEPQLPLFIQLMITELMIDALRLASLNTPSTLGNSLSVVAGLILGDYAVEVGWFVPEVILYMALVAISNFTQPSFELGYAFKFMRMLLLVAIALADVIGFVLGVALILVLVACNKSVDGSRSYLYPLIPFNAKALKRHLFRHKLNGQKKQKGQKKQPATGEEKTPPAL